MTQKCGDNAWQSQVVLPRNYEMTYLTIWNFTNFSTVLFNAVTYGSVSRDENGVKTLSSKPEHSGDGVLCQE